MPFSIMLFDLIFAHIPQSKYINSKELTFRGQIQHPS